MEELNRCVIKNDLPGKQGFPSFVSLNMKVPLLFMCKITQRFFKRCTGFHSFLLGQSTPHRMSERPTPHPPPFPPNPWDFIKVATPKFPGSTAAM